MPRFYSGDFREWKTFHDLFSNTIHNNDNLCETSKFKYLKSSLKDEAANLLRHIAVTDANYSVAWAKLLARYDKTASIINSFIKAFIQQLSVTHLTASALRTLTDTSDEVIRGLAALGAQAKSKDHWLIYIIVDKLDNQTRHKFQDLLDFLQIQCHALES